MHKEILINETSQETRIATVEGGLVQEVLVERVSNRNIVGNIYLGVVVRVLPGMQAAFVDIGQDRTAFLPVRNLKPRKADPTQSQQRNPATSSKTSIAKILSEGERILVEVIKDPLGSKGARLSGHISLSGRNLVFQPHGNVIRVSQQIEDQTQRTQLLDRLKKQQILTSISGGFVLRTVGDCATDPELQSEMTILDRLWKKIITKQKRVSAPALVHEALPLALRVVRDLDWKNIDSVKIDSKKTTDQVNQFLNEISPDVRDKITRYSEAKPIFDLYDIEHEIQKALHRKVPLKSGGYLVIEQGEAMTTIDVNTGSYVGTNNPEATQLKTNLEAVEVITHQLRLRNIGGIIVIDFIDMAHEESRDQVSHALNNTLARDNNRAKAGDMTALGLVEITRKRTGESLKQILTESCPTCDGRGTQNTPQTTCYEIFREILRVGNEFKVSGYQVIASQPVINLLTGSEVSGIVDLEARIGHKIKLQADPKMRQEQYNVIPL